MLKRRTQSRRVWAVHAGAARRVLPTGALQHQRDGQEPPRLVRRRRRPRLLPHLGRRQIRPYRHRHPRLLPQRGDRQHGSTNQGNHKRVSNLDAWYHRWPGLLGRSPAGKNRWSGRERARWCPVAGRGGTVSPPGIGTSSGIGGGVNAEVQAGPEEWAGGLPSTARPPARAAALEPGPARRVGRLPGERPHD